jgi:hypothetical protein
MLLLPTMWGGVTEGDGGVKPINHVLYMNLNKP